MNDQAQPLKLGRLAMKGCDAMSYPSEVCFGPTVEWLQITFITDDAQKGKPVLGKRWNGKHYDEIGEYKQGRELSKALAEEVLRLPEEGHGAAVRALAADCVFHIESLP